MKFSIALATEVDSWRWVQRAEELGFHAAWFYDTQLLNPDAFICMGLAASKTSRIRLGTGVLVPSNRIEPVTANALVTLNKIAPGRIDFGVGTGFTARRTMGLNAIPLKRTKTYVERVQKLIRGETVDWDFEGKDRKIAFLNPDLGLINIEDDIPTWISAFGPKSRKMAAELNANWINFSTMRGAVESLEAMRDTWRAEGIDPDSKSSCLFILGAVLTGDKQIDGRRLMAQAGVSASTVFHNMADEFGPMGGLAPDGPLNEVFKEYMKVHDTYEPADAKYLTNHRGHLMFVRPEETHITPELARATSFSGTKDELVTNLRTLKDAGYGQVTVQLVHGAEEAIEDWAEVFKAI